MTGAKVEDLKPGGRRTQPGAIVGTSVPDSVWNRTMPPGCPSFLGY